MCGMCGGEKIAESWRRICDGILSVGWALVTIPDDGPRNPSFAYTMGLSELGHPEFIVFGRSDLEAHAAVAPLAHAVLRGEFFDEGDDLTRLYPAAASPPQLLRFPDSTTHLLWANDMYRGADDAPIRALHVVWASDLGEMRQLTSCAD
ncbi:DUF4262 domain-containing protein [Kribbella sp. NBC_01245]|uniref:DUF4262 domain-containing protein n=1 Tax=Kribbella sp. NBC_01245 TaxID=2903578 RepID=UPI002E2D014D|nr:DUF4262 domain-containing protein [Kribbella sp. NBC_01245]